MLTYTFSRREKAMLLGLVVILLVLAWYMLVFQRTTNEINRINSEIATVQGDTTVATAQVGQKHMMQKVIEESKAAGIAPSPVPRYDNMQPLMAELNRIMGATAGYTMAFDPLDRETSPEYVLRGIRIDFSCDSVASAESVVAALESGGYACSVDTVSINDSTVGGPSRMGGTANSGPVTASVHVTFFERA